VRSNVLKVLAIAHEHRRPGYWRERLQGSHLSANFGALCAPSRYRGVIAIKLILKPTLVYRDRSVQLTDRRHRLA
jgi:hypothetical protein